MQFVPWRYIADWSCISCGKCCKLYSVALNFQEWLNIVKNYGVEQTVFGLNRLYLRRKVDGSCPFLHDFSGMHFCGLQHMKPSACKLWPFKILGYPKYGYTNEAVYECGGNRAFVYSDSGCAGLRYGTPTWEFANYTLREFMEIAMGLRSSQQKTTANIGSLQPYARFRI
jgi:Fe-S-cluster containining protein